MESLAPAFTCLISGLIVLILYDENHIEPGEDRRLEVNILNAEDTSASSW